ncbi:hypothetical protein NDU88_001661 [Pleurodeles waltl]|uniref:Uncharacterized protein n=1 Tax=Pleurodeles waltl TaxID=8319 RepID=A0AAV7NBE2_PLEWA|nr:hypothetical protein NDU88_001661 [Pleurodeles waltl]
MVPFGSFVCGPLSLRALVTHTPRWTGKAVDEPAACAIWNNSSASPRGPRRSEQHYTDREQVNEYSEDRDVRRESEVISDRTRVPPAQAQGSGFLTARTCFGMRGRRDHLLLGYETLAAVRYWW